MKTVYFLPERSDYYKRKKREYIAKKRERENTRQDAIYIRYYGMSAFLELFPEAKGFGIEWHQNILAELITMENEYMGKLINGIALGYTSSKSKKANRRFKAMISSLFKPI